MAAVWVEVGGGEGEGGVMRWVAHTYDPQGAASTRAWVTFGAYGDERWRKDYLMVRLPWVWWKHFRTGTDDPMWSVVRGWHRPVLVWWRLVGPTLVTEELKFKVWWEPVRVQRLP